MNVRNMWYGHTEGMLTEQGIEQAKLAGKHLKNETYTKIFVSDLIRTKDTFDLIRAMNVHKYQSIF